VAEKPGHHETAVTLAGDGRSGPGVRRRQFLIETIETIETNLEAAGGAS
jgi:hypothetical protein